MTDVPARTDGAQPAPLDPDLFDPVCPSSAMPFRVGDKWTGMVIRCLEGGPRRFTELRVPLRAITAKVLSETLRAMERDGLLTRTAYDENPPRVEYALTPLGRTLVPLLDAARAWSATHLPQLLAARSAHEPDASGSASDASWAVCDSKRSPGNGSATSSPSDCST